MNISNNKYIYNFENVQKGQESLISENEKKSSISSIYADNRENLSKKPETIAQSSILRRSNRKRKLTWKAEKMHKNKNNKKEAAPEKTETVVQPILRRSNRKRKLTPKAEEILKNNEKKPASKKRKIEKEMQPNDQCALTKHMIDQNYLHHYPISNKNIDNILNMLNDQKQGIRKLTKKQVDELDQAISKSQQTGLYPGIYLCSLGEDLGMGTFLNPFAQPLKKGTMLGIYSGKNEVFQIDHLGDADLSYAFELTDIISLEEKEHLIFFKNKDTFRSRGNYIIYCNAKEKGNWIRYLNHGAKSANCEAQLVRYPARCGMMNAKKEQWIVVVTVIKQVNPGEQLLLNYGARYWKKYNIIPKNVDPRSFMLDKNKQISST